MQAVIVTPAIGLLVITLCFTLLALLKIPKFHLISWYGNFVEKQSLQSFRQFNRNNVETVLFRKISTSENQLKFRYFPQCGLQHPQHHYHQITEIFIIIFIGSIYYIKVIITRVYKILDHLQLKGVARFSKVFPSKDCS